MVDYDVLIQGNNLACADGALGISSVVLLTTDAGPLLFDTGHYGNRAGLLRGLRRHGLEPNDVGRVFLSHLHWDHSLNVDLFEGCEIIVSRQELDYARRPHAEDIHMPWGILDQLAKHRLTVLERTTDLAGGLQAFPAPGHTPGLYALAFDHDAHGRVVVAGDAIKYPKEIITGTPDLVFDTVEHGRDTIADILERADRIVPGHFVELRRARSGWVWDEAAPFDLRVR